MLINEDVKEESKIKNLGPTHRLGLGLATFRDSPVASQRPRTMRRYWSVPEKSLHANIFAIISRADLSHHNLNRECDLPQAELRCVKIAIVFIVHQYCENYVVPKCALKGTQDSAPSVYEIIFLLLIDHFRPYDSHVAKSVSY